MKFFFAKLRNGITYRIERFLMGGAANQLLFIAMIIFVVSLIAGFAVYSAYPGTGTFKDAVWWAFLRLSDPGYLGDDTGALRRLISTIVTVLGYVLFMGSLVAIMTQWLNGTMRKLERGLTPISHRGHVVILGWTNRTPIIVKEFLLSEERTSRFLRSLKRSKLRIVILAEEVTGSIIQELRDELGNLWDPAMIILRSGTPLRIDHIKRVDVLNAGIVIIPGASFAYGGAENIDTRSFKAVMSIYQYALQAEAPFPSIVAEVTDVEKVPVIRSLYRGSVEVVAGNSIISRIMTQNIRHHGMAVVYDELLSNAGNEIYVRESFLPAGTPFGAAGDYFPHALPIGILRGGSKGAAIMNPPGGTLIEEGDRIVLIAEEYRYTDSHSPGREVPAVPEEEAMDSLAARDKGGRILIVGWSHKTPFLLKEIMAGQSGIAAVDNFSVLDAAERTGVLARHGIDEGNVPLTCLTGNSTHHEDIQQIDLASYTEILMVANDWMDSGEEADARTIMGYILLKKAVSLLESPPSFIVELMDPDNRSLVSHEDDVIITPLLISYSLAQISLNCELRIVYDELFSTGGTEIYLVPLTRYMDNVMEPVVFAEIVLTVRRHGETAIGLRTCDGAGRRSVRINPPRGELFQPGEDDQVIVLSSGG